MPREMAVGRATFAPGATEGLGWLSGYRRAGWTRLERGWLTGLPARGAWRPPKDFLRRARAGRPVAQFR